MYMVTQIWKYIINIWYLLILTISKTILWSNVEIEYHKIHSDPIASQHLSFSEKIFRFYFQKNVICIAGNITITFDLLIMLSII